MPPYNCFGLQAHFTRTNLSGDLATDQARVLVTATRLLQACVDVITSSSWLKPAIVAMDMSQQVVQAMWQSDPVLLQLPHFTRDLAKKCTQAKISTIIPAQEDQTSLTEMEVCSWECCQGRAFFGFLISCMKDSTRPSARWIFTVQRAVRCSDL